MAMNRTVAVVTGAGGAIGSAVARRLASEGMDLVLSDRSAESLDSTVRMLPVECVAEAIVGDVAEETHHRDLVDLAESLGQLTVSVLNAGVYLPGLSWELSVDQWRLHMDVNFWGVLHGVRAAIPGMIRRGTGHVVAMASGAGLIATPALGPYVASKHAVVGLMESLRHELNRVAPSVHASVVCPGNIRSEMAANSLATAGIDDESLSGEVDMLAAQIRAGNAAGGDPSTVADAIWDAVLANRFWVLPQPEVAWGAVDRARRIDAGEEPVDLFG